MVRRKDYTLRLRMGATNYDLTAKFSDGTSVNYDMSKMHGKERKALTFSVVSAFRESLNAKAA